jgi:hypothetical protein
MTTQTAGAAPPTRAPDRFPLWRLLVLGFAWFLGVSIELSPAGLLTAIAGDLHVSVAAVGTLTTLFALGNALFVLPSTALSLRFTRRAAIEAAMALFVLSDLTVALAPSVVIADFGRFAGGAAYGMVCALFPSVAVHPTRRTRRGEHRRRRPPRPVGLPAAEREASTSCPSSQAVPLSDGHRHDHRRGHGKGDADARGVRHHDRLDALRTVKNAPPRQLEQQTALRLSTGNAPASSSGADAGTALRSMQATRRPVVPQLCSP